MDERKASRLEQLLEGVGGAAAALPEAHAELGSRAARAADRVVSRFEAVAAAGRIDEAVERMERLHYGLLRTCVLEEAPREAGVEEDLAELERLVGAAEDGGSESGETPGASG